MSEGSAATTGRPAVPASVTLAIRLVWLLVAILGVTAILTALMHDDLVRVWAEGNPEAKALVESGGVEALEASSISVPSFAPLAFATFFVLAGFALVLAAFLRTGHDWARHSIAALVLFAGFATVIPVVRGLPVAFLVPAVASLLVDAALLWLLYRRETSAYLRGR
jgi:hypothetical protein